MVNPLNAQQGVAAGVNYVSERFIVIGGLIIIAVGLANAALSNGDAKKLSTVAFGGIVLVLLLSLVSAFGGGWTKLATAFMVLAVVAVLLNELPSVLSKLGVIK